MNTLSRFSVLLFCCYWLLSLLIAPGCANIIPPTGGPRDSLPPVLMGAAPKDSTLQFNNNKIVLSFDEYVQLDNNLTDNVIVSPNPDNMPLFENKLKTVTIKLKDSLKPNTTYSINFGRAIKDVNESNVLKNFTYVFSTGDTIHNATISGKVTLAETGETDSTLIAVLHVNMSDTAVKKLKPDYYTRLDSGGNFTFRFLPIAAYSIYVMPNDYTKKYDDSTKFFAFYDTIVFSGINTEPVKLYAYQQAKPLPKPASSSSSQAKAKPGDEKLKITNNLENNQQDLLGDLQISLNKPITKFDSSKIILADTNYKAIKGFAIAQDTGLKKFILRYKWPENEPFRLIIHKDAFADSAGLSLTESDTLSFTTKRESQYGSVRIHFNNINLSANPLLQLVQNNAIVYTASLTTNEWYVKLFEPGEYFIRILSDENKNGVWDPGNFDEKRQPEKVLRISRKLTIKANWDNEVDVNL